MAIRVASPKACGRGLKAAAAGAAGWLGWPFDAVVPVAPGVAVPAVVLAGGATSSGEEKYIGKKCGSTNQNSARIAPEIPRNSHMLRWFSIAPSFPQCAA